MKRMMVVLATVVFALLVSPAFAAPHLNWGSEVNPGQCEGVTGNPVVNITHSVVNDGDTRTGGGFWALSEYNKHVQIWQVGPNTFCALVRYVGSFVTLGGASPQGTDGSLAPGIDGTFEGGYRGLVTGSLNPAPTKKTRGNIGSFNFNCQADDPGNYSTCTGIFSWAKTYFNPGYSFAYEAWGWVYHAGHNGTWVNSAGGNEGDITD